MSYISIIECDFRIFKIEMVLFIFDIELIEKWMKHVGFASVLCAFHLWVRMLLTWKRIEMKWKQAATHKLTRYVKREGETDLCFCCEYAADCEIDQQLHEMKL